MGINVEYIASAGGLVASLGVGVMAFMPNHNGPGGDPMQMVDSLQLGIAAGGTALSTLGMIASAKK